MTATITSLRLRPFALLAHCFWSNIGNNGSFLNNLWGTLSQAAEESSLTVTMKDSDSSETGIWSIIVRLSIAWDYGHTLAEGVVAGLGHGSGLREFL